MTVQARIDYRANVPRFFVFWGLANLNLWMPIWVLFFQQRGVTLSQLGVLEGVSMAMMAFSEVATGAVADRWGRAKSMVIGALCFGTALLTLTAGVFTPIFLVGYLVWGAAFTFISGADLAFLYDSLRAAGHVDEYPTIAGRYQAVMHASAAVASLLGGWLATLDMRYCFYVSAAAMFAAAAVATSFREPPRSEPGSPGVVVRYREILRDAVRIVTGETMVRYQILFGAAANTVSFLLLWVMLQPYAAGVGMPVWSLGVIVLAARGASIVGSVATGQVTRRIGPRAVSAAVVATVGVGQLLLWSFPSRAAVAVFIVVAGASAVMGPTLSSLLNQMIPSGQRATILSIQSLLWSLFVAVTEPALLIVADHAGVANAVAMSGTLTVVFVVPLLLLWWRTLGPLADVREVPRSEDGRRSSGRRA